MQGVAPDGVPGNPACAEPVPVGGVTYPFAGAPVAAGPLVGVGLVLGVVALGGAAWCVRRRR